VRDLGAGFNQRKAEILEFLERVGEATAGEVARELGIGRVNASRLLGLYFREGLVGRRTVDGFGTRAYRITERGRERLGWIRP
jgi:predicted ArsR family transcriptional regulator